MSLNFLDKIFQGVAVDCAAPLMFYCDHSYAGFCEITFIPMKNWALWEKEKYRDSGQIVICSLVVYIFNYRFVKSRRSFPCKLNIFSFINASGFSLNKY